MAFEDRPASLEHVAAALGITEKHADELIKALKQYEEHAQSLWGRMRAHDEVIDVMQRIMAHLAVKAAKAASVPTKPKGSVE